MYFFDNPKHHLPHIHAECGETEGISAISEAEMFEGGLPGKQQKLVTELIETQGTNRWGTGNWRLQDRRYSVSIARVRCAMVKVTEAKPRGNYTLEVRLDDGRSGPQIVLKECVL